MKLRTSIVTAALVATAAVGAAVGAATDSVLGGGGTTTVVRTTAAGAQPAAARTGTLTVNQVYSRARKGVVEVTVRTVAGASPFPNGGGSESATAQGSGFVYDTAGHVVTNQHVVDGAQSVTVTLWNGTRYSATVVGTDASTDLAVLKIDAPASALQPLALGDSADVAVGDGVVAIGSPFGLEETVTSGIVSALHRQMTSPNNFTIDDSIQTDAAINHGNSGGPLLNMSGQVIGVTAQIESDSGGNDGVGFAIPSKTVRSVVGQILTSGAAEHAYLGVGVDDASNGAEPSTVRAGSAADAGGLQTGDVITKFGGDSIGSGDELRAAVDARKPGDSVTITYVRDGATHTTKVKLGTRPSS
jgi:putative serine protease PepD